MSVRLPGATIEALFPPTMVHRRVCPNALRVVVVEMLNAQTTAVFWAVRVGSRDEVPRLNGISHFVEHLKFRGTDRFPSEIELHAQFESLGALSNGSTGREATFFWLEVRPEKLAGAIETLGEVACSTTFNGLEVERRVVLDEMANYQDSDGVVWDLHEKMMLNLWPHQPFGQPMIGSAATLRTLTLADLEAHLNRHYTADNSVVVIAGAVDVEETFAQVERHFARLRRGPVPSRHPAPPVAPGRLLCLQTGSNRTEGLFAFAKVTTELRDFLALEMLAGIIGPAGFGRLHRSLRAKTGLAYSAAAHYSSFTDVAMLTISLNVASGKLLQSTNEVLAHLVELRERGPTAQEARGGQAGDADPGGVPPE